MTIIEFLQARIAERDPDADEDWPGQEAMQQLVEPHAECCIVVPCDAMRVHAAVFAEHLDYDTEWAMDAGRL